jgi:adenine-specific DNA-methyltransferase
MAEKLEMMSSNIIQENIDYIASKFPNALKEVMENGKLVKKIDFDVLKQELSTVVIDDKQERYQMTWPDKKKSILLANSRINATLRPVKEKSVDFDNTQNLYIEGDNLDVLKLLRETYLGKVKMIYIDPPYNTGNDFVYEDDFSQSSEEFLENSGQFDQQGNRLFQNTDSNGRFHTDWLNMMYPRLKVAKDLLTDDGFIFISIDDNEVINLSKTCDEVYGKENFKGIIIRKVMEGGKSDSKGFAIEHEYCLVYSKSSNSMLFRKQIGRQEHYNKKDQYFDTRGYYYLKPLENGGLGYVPSLDYPIIGPDGNEIYPGDFNGDNGYRWVWSNSRYKKALELDMIEFVVSQKDKSKYKVYYKIYENVDSDGNLAVKELPFGSLYLDGYTNRQAINDLKRLFNKRIFDYPKPVSFIKELCKMASTDGDIILDFFAGSSSTVDALFQINIDDQKNRKFILVQLPEMLDSKSEAYKEGYHNICDIGQERIRRAGKKIKEDAGVLGQNLDIGFRVLKLDSSNMNDVYYNPNSITQDLLGTTIDNIKVDRTPLDLLFQTMLELGIELSAKIEEKELFGKKYFVVNENDIVACFDDGINDELVKELAKIKSIYAVFKDSAFSSDSANINCEQIFKSISPSTNIKVI